MTTKVEHRSTGPDVDELIAVLGETTDPQVIELVADELNAARDRRAIRPLLMHLGDRRVQDDPDVEDAVCHALISLGVMCSTGNVSFSLRPRRALADDVVETIRELAPVIPWRYFGTAHN
jgi:hypothetical protein